MSPNYLKKVSFIIFCYNQETYIEEVINSALLQTCSPLEIIISDDCSSDRTFSIAQSVVDKYIGSHKVVLNRNNVNLGLIEHVNKVCMSIASGDYLVFAAGDDISLPIRVEATLNVMLQSESIKSLSMNYRSIDSFGNLIDKGNEQTRHTHTYSLKDFVAHQPLPSSGCSRAYHKDVFDVFGPLSPTCGVEDAALLFRGILLGTSSEVKEVGVLYRRHTNSLSQKIDFSDMEGKIFQRERDISTAVRKGLLPNDDTASQLTKMIATARRKHQTIDKVNSENNKIRSYFLNIAFNNDFSLKEKTTIGKSLMKRLLS